MSSSVLDMFVKLGMDDGDFKKGLSNAESESKSSGAKIGEALKSGAAVAIKGIVAGVTAASAAVTALTKASIDNYAEFEQLVGGAELMFGDGYDYIMKKSQDAYKTVQMSQNEYLTQVNGFAVGLRESLGGNEQAAAELADRIVTAEADIVSATGNTQEAVQAAFNGIMKGNFTMLDNLQIGITPTKEGMQEVIDLMNKMNGTKYEMGNLADMQNAIVDYVKYAGMAGYATAEGAKTIQGSLASMKGAWSNLLTGFSDPNADLGLLIGNMVDSASTAFDNLLPVATQALSGISTFIEKIAPAIATELPNMIQQILPALIEAATGLFTSLAQALPSLIQVIVQQLPTVISEVVTGLQEAFPAIQESLGELFNQLMEWLTTELPNIIPDAMNMLMEFTGNLRENFGVLVDAGLDMIMALANALIDNLPVFIKTVPTIVSNIAGLINDNMPKIIATGIKLIGALVSGLIQAIPTIIENIPQIIKAIVDVITAFNWLALGSQIITGIGNGIKAMFNHIPDMTKSIGQRAMDLFKNLDWRNIGRSVVEFIKNGVSNLPHLIPNALKSIGTNALNAFKSINWLSVGSALIDGIVAGISGGLGKIVDAAKGAAQAAFNAAKNLLGIHSPSRKGKWLGQMYDLGIAGGIDENVDAIEDSVSNVSDAMYNSVAGGEIGLSNLSANGAVGTNQNNSFVINIYGAEEKTARELADIIDQKIAEKTDRSVAVWA